MLQVAAVVAQKNLACIDEAHPINGTVSVNPCGQRPLSPQHFFYSITVRPQERCPM